MTSGERFVLVLVLGGYVLVALHYWITSARRGLDDPERGISPRSRRADLRKELRRHG